MPLRSDSENFALIRVIGVGGGGSNAVNRMIRAEMMGVEFIACNTDAQALLQSDAPAQDPDRRQDHPRPRRRRRLDDRRTRRGGGLATRSPTRSRDSDMVFITAGLGGGTGSGAAPVVAEIAKEQGALTIGVVTKPFSFEGARRKLVAEKAAEELKAKVDTLITIPNDRLRDVVQKNTSILDAFRVVDDVLRQGVAGHQRHHHGARTHQPRLRRRPHDHEGRRLGAHGHRPRDGREPRRSRPPARRSPARCSRSTSRARRGSCSTSPARSNLTLWEVTEAAEEIRAAADPEANIIFGTSFNERLGEEVMITVIATGFDGRRRPTPRRTTTGERGRGATTVRARRGRRGRAGSRPGARLPRRARAPARRDRRDRSRAEATAVRGPPRAIGRRRPAEEGRQPTTPTTWRFPRFLAPSARRQDRPGGVAGSRARSRTRVRSLGSRRLAGRS